MSKIKIERAQVDGIKADFVKGEVKITLRVSLETGLEIRDELSDLANPEQVVSVEIKPWQSRIPGLDKLAESVRNGEVTLTAGGEKESANGDAKAD